MDDGLTISAPPRVRLGDVVTINPGIDRDELEDETPVTFVPMPAVEALTGRMDTSDARPYSAVKKGFTAFATGDVLFAKITPCMENGKMAIVPRLPHGVGFGSTEFHVMRPLDDLDERYLYYFVSSSAFRHEAQHNMTGAVGQKRVPRPWLENQRIPLPPLPEQHRIVEKIETLFARLDKGDEAVRQVQALLKRYRQSVLKAAVTGDLTADWREANGDRLEHGRDLLARILRTRRETWEGLGRYTEPEAPDTSGLPELPEGWAWASVDQLSRTVTKGSSPNWQGFEYTSEGVLFVRSQNVGWGTLRLEEKVYLDHQFNRKEPKSVIRPRDVLLNIVGASIGRAAIANDAVDGANCNQAVALIRLVETSLAEHLIGFLLAPTTQARIHSEKVDVARANYSLAQIRELAVPLPPLAEVVEIQNRLSQSLSIEDALSSQCETELTRSTALRQSILKQAFSGRLVPQDPSNETASALLDRIRAAGPVKKKRKTAA